MAGLPKFANVQSFVEGADILQQVDVSDIFTSMALGIAKAQEKLDNNSISQLIKLSEQQIAGKSLLELGFVPAFYSFTYADISASINLQMALKEDFNVGLELEFNNAKKKGYSQEHLDQLEESKTTKERTEFKSSEDVSMKSSETRSISIKSNRYNLDQQKGSVHMVEDLAQELRKAEGVARVNTSIKTVGHVFENQSTGFIVQYLGGYVTISNPNLESCGILKIKDYTTSTPIDLDGTGTVVSDFLLTDKLATTFSGLEALFDGTSPSDTIIAFTKDGISTNGTDFQKLNFYFDFDEFRILDFSYHEADISNSLELKIYLTILAEILKSDSSSKVKMIGHADSSGFPEYNSRLGTNRANTVRDFLVSLGVNFNQLGIATKGEEEAVKEGDNKPNPKFRKVEINLETTTDYIYFKGGKYSTDATPTTGDNCFIFSGISPKTSGDLKFSIKGEGISASAVDEKSIVWADIKTKTATQYYYEELNDVVYLLHKDSFIDYSLYSENSEEIDIKEVKESESSTNSQVSSIKISESITSKSILKKDMEKVENPRTVAISGAFDIRYTRQFDISMDGNASMSAHLVALPPPEALKTYLLDNLKK